MAAYEVVFDSIGLREWCDGGATGGPMTMADLLAQADGGVEAETSFWQIPFPSLDVLHEACGAIPRSRDYVQGVENTFYAVKTPLQFVLDPITQPLSWLLRGSLWLFENTPWFVMVAVLLLLTWAVTRRVGLVILVAIVMGIYLLTDYYILAMQTLSIIALCTVICILIGVPIGIWMSKSDRVRDITVPILDMLQTLPTFVYLVPLIILFGATEPKLYGIAIIMYAAVPVIRLTNLGIRLVDKDVVEAAEAFGMTSRQKLFKVEIPLALPNIMAGVNQTIMMALAMVVIASLVAAPGLGVMVLRGIRNLEIGQGLVSGAYIVLMAIALDRVSKAALNRINVSHS